MLTALALVSACGAVLVTAAWRAGSFAIGLIGGDRYAELGPYAVGFAAVGALYAVVFVLVNAQIAAGVRWPGAPLWVTLAGLAVAVRLLHPPTLGGILTYAVATALLAIVVMIPSAVRLPAASAHPPR